MTIDRAPSQEAKHLTEEELDDVLLGISTPAFDLHLASCAQCSGALTEFREAMGEFNKASMAWSQAKANSMPLDLPRKRFAIPFSVRSIGSVALPAVLAFVVALAITEGLHRHSETASPASAGVTQSARPTDALQNDEIASDNAMLAAIHSELYSRVPSPVEEYQPQTVRTRRASSAQVRD